MPVLIDDSSTPTQLLSQGGDTNEVIGLWVSGATDVLCNGLYAEDRLHNGRPTYVSTSDAVVYFDDWWKMNCQSGFDGWLYSSPGAPSDNDPTPPAGNWTTYGYNHAGVTRHFAPSVSLRMSHGNWVGPPPGDEVIPDVVELDNFDCSEQDVPGFNGVKTLCDSYLRFVRAEFGQRQPQYILQELRDRENVDLSAGGSEGTGRSGQSFFITNEYVLKTMSQRDQESFTLRVRSYTTHMMRNWRDSTLLRVFALLKDASDNVWCLMNNWIPLYLNLSPRYDVKGSTYHRRNGWGATQLKDEDWVEREERALIPPAVRQENVRAMNSDSSWLESKELIDYSIIFAQGTFGFPPLDRDGCARAVAPMCIPGSRVPCFDAGYRSWRSDPQWAGMYRFFCDNNTRLPKSYRGHTCVGSVYEEEAHDIKFNLACYGIIDISKYWGKRSRAECASSLSCTPPFLDRSVKPPDQYRERWIQFMENVVFRENPLTRGGRRYANAQPFLPNAAQCVAWGQALGITPGRPTVEEKEALCGGGTAAAAQLDARPGSHNRSQAVSRNGNSPLALAVAVLLAATLWE